MDFTIVPKLQDLVAQERWEQAADFLRQLSPADSATAFMVLPFDQQHAFFRKLPIDFAAALIGDFPYFHAYVLLHSRPGAEMRAIVEAMHPDESDRFLDDLPEEAWQSLMAELSGKPSAAPSPAESPSVAHAPAAVERKLAVARPAAPPEVIVEARGIEKSFRQPDGRDIQVI